MQLVGISALPTVPITLEQSVWPAAQPELILPEGITEADAWERHSIPDLINSWHPNCPPQIIPHRGVYDYSLGIPDCSMKALEIAVAGRDGSGGNAVEFDVVFINDQPYIMHDRTGVRQTHFQKPWSEWPPAIDQPDLNFIIRDVEGDHYTEKYVLTDLKVTGLFDCMDKLLRLNPKSTFFIDARDQDSARLVALLSKHKEYTNNALVQIYPYTYRNASEFIDLAENKFGASAGWMRKVKIAFYLKEDMLARLANVSANSLDYWKMFEAGKAWLSSMSDAGLSIFGFGFPANGIGLRLEFGPMHVVKKVIDLDGNPVKDAAIQAKFLRDRVMLDLKTWAKTEYPICPSIGVCIASSYFTEGKHYTSNFHSGHPIEWDQGPASHGRMLMSIPSTPVDLGFDLIISDRRMQVLNAALGTCKYKYPDDIIYSPNIIKY